MNGTKKKKILNILIVNCINYFTFCLRYIKFNIRVGVGYKGKGGCGGVGMVYRVGMGVVGWLGYGRNDDNHSMNQC